MDAGQGQGLRVSVSVFDLSAFAEMEIAGSRACVERTRLGTGEQRRDEVQPEPWVKSNRLADWNWVDSGGLVDDASWHRGLLRC